MTELAFATARLQGRPLQAGDREHYCGLYQCPRVMRKIAPPLDRAGAQRAFASTLTAQQPGRSLLWVLEDRAGHFVGLLGLTWHGPETAELGIMLSLGANGKGYPVEAVGALVALAFSRLGLQRILGRFHPQQLASARFFRRLGFTMSEQLFQGPRGPYRQCRMTKAQWDLSGSPLGHDGA